MSAAAQLPFVAGQAEKKATRRYRKQLLPVGEIEHPIAGKVNFDLADIVRNFDAGAYDQVPFLLANERNEHNDDPERVRGMVTGVELTDQGLFGTIETTERGATLLEENPGLPVSVRVRRPEVGRFKDRSVLAHVLGTLDPVAKGMSGWQAIDAAAGQQVTDLSGGAFSLPDMSTDALEQDQPDAKVFSEEEMTKLRAILAGQSETPPADPAKPDAKAAEVTEEEAETILAGLGIGDAATEPAEPEVKEPVVAQLSDADQRRLTELSNSLDAERTRSASDRWAREKAEYAQAGVPPAMLDLASPVMSVHSDATIDFSNAEGNAEQTTARTVVGKMLDNAKGTIDFSETGSPEAVTPDNAAAEQREKWGKEAEDRGDVI